MFTETLYKIELFLNIHCRCFDCFSAILDKEKDYFV